ncbi:uncharacterized protein [Amphiura filiformis]|uniref:uncharacterized protein n=1 Tax=Amphiura filiformis TaxID=82378 RepID=UPI003B22372E
MIELQLYEPHTDHSDTYQDLTQCGICLSLIKEPKALPCLHSFCLKCLSKDAEDRRGTVVCPMCRQDFLIPPEGIKGFITNFVINTLKDRQEVLSRLQTKDARIPCSCCGATDNKAGAYCTDCGGFICEKCVDFHNTDLSVNNHKTVPFVDLQSGKVDIKSVMRQEYCKKHKGQILEFYCKTCDVFLCVGCTADDHSGHTLVNLERATDEQRSEIKKLTIDCGQVSQQVAKTLKSVEQVRNNLQKSEQKAKADLHQAAEELRTKVLAEIQQREIEMEAQITQAAAENIKQIDTQKDRLQLQQIRLQTPLQMVSEMTQSGSDNDFALIFSSLKSNMSHLRDLKTQDADESFGEIDFIRSESLLSSVPNLGSLSVGSKRKGTTITHVSEIPATSASGSRTDTTSSVSSSTRIVSPGSFATASGISGPIQRTLGSASRTRNIETWKLIKQVNSSGKLSCSRHAAFMSGGDFLITDFSQPSILQVFNQSGHFKRKLDIGHGLKTGQISYPWNVVVSPDGRIFTTQETSFVNVYDPNGNFKYHFPTRSPSNVLSKTRDAQLMGLAIDNQGCVLVGEWTQKYISKHSVDGSHISSIKVPISPLYIAVTSDDRVIVSSGGGGTHILDTNGSILHTLNSPPCVSDWCPYGICFTPDDEIYLANYSVSDGNIYRYSWSGQYLGRIIKEVDCPAGITRTNDNTLVVVEDDSVKMFSRQ